MESDPIQRARRALAVGVAFALILLILAGLTRSRPTRKPALPPAASHPAVSLTVTSPADSSAPPAAVPAAPAQP